MDDFAPVPLIARWSSLTLICLSAHERYYADLQAAGDAGTAEMPEPSYYPALLRALADVLDQHDIPDDRIDAIVGNGEMGYGAVYAYVMDWNDDLPLTPSRFVAPD